MNENLKNKLNEIALNTFELTCFMFPLNEWEIEEANFSSIKADNLIQAIVHFDGVVKGGLILSAASELVNAIAANMLGVEQAKEEEKEGALCEIANIICGNMVPLFAKQDNICYIHPPKILKQDEDITSLFENMQLDQIRILLDEGIAEISVYYAEGG